MDNSSSDNFNNLIEIRKTRDQAEFLRDQLLAEYRRITEEDDPSLLAAHTPQQLLQGQEAMRKAIAAANRAIASIDQALREMERTSEE
ncbi:MAG: hypothetical protein JW860_16115 [Sedimentisphaerales bacterium]|nr:hypothetical protein [Sedimentisphaerales bacterium]